MSLTDYTASIDIATGSNYVFTNSSNNDVVVYASDPKQRILFGHNATTQQTAAVLIGSNNMDVTVDTTYTGKVAAQYFEGDGSRLTGVVLATNGMGAGNGV